MNHRSVSARIDPEAGMDVLSKAEVRRLTAATTGNLLWKVASASPCAHGGIPCSDIVAKHGER